MLYVNGAYLKCGDRMGNMIYDRVLLTKLEDTISFDQMTLSDHGGAESCYAEFRRDLAEFR